MSVIDVVKDANSVLCEFRGYTELTVDTGLRLFGGAHFSGSTAMSVSPSGFLFDTTTFPGSTSVSALGHIVGEPNYFGSVNCEIDQEVTLTPTHRIIPYMNCTFSVPVDARPNSRDAEQYPVYIIVDIVPPEPTSKTQDYVYELLINGTTEVKIKSFTYSEAKADVGNSLSFELANVDDIPAVEGATSFRFRIGIIVAGVTTWKTYIDSGIINSSNYTLSRQGNAPLTQFQFTNKSAIQAKLAKTPSRDLVVYDPITVPVNAADFETLHDITGGTITTELLAIGHLSLSAIFDLVFVSRLGFAGVIHNLPNFPVKRIDFSMTDSYLSSLSGIIGVFDPLVFEYQNKVWIIDSTSILPTGFPVSTEVTVSNSSSIRVTKNFDTIDAYLLIYSEDGRSFDFYTTRTETTFQETGSVAAGNYTKTEITRTIRDYRTFSQPTVVIKSDIERDRRETSNYQGFTVGRTIEDYTYDFFGRQTLSVKSQSSLLPQLPDGDMVLTEYRNERIEIRYGADPFQPSRQIQQQIWTDVSGLMIVDNDNLVLGEPFKQDYMSAYQSGNLLDSMDTQFGLIKSIRETLEPITKGQFQLETIVHDYILKAVTRETTEPKNGDFSINGVVSKQHKVVIPYNEFSLDGDNVIIKKLYSGDLPLNDAIDLANRLMKRINRGQCQASVDYIGTNPNLRRGLPIAVKDLNDDVLATCLVEGFSISGTFRSLATSIEGLKIG